MFTGQFKAKGNVQSVKVENTDKGGKRVALYLGVQATDGVEIVLDNIDNLTELMAALISIIKVGNGEGLRYLNTARKQMIELAESAGYDLGIETEWRMWNEAYRPE